MMKRRIMVLCSWRLTTISRALPEEVVCILIGRIPYETRLESYVHHPRSCVVFDVLAWLWRKLICNVVRILPC